MARELVAIHPDSMILSLAQGDPEKISAKIVFDAAREEDPIGKKVFRRYVSYLSQAIASIMQFLDPEIIVLGGGVSKAGAFLLDAVRQEVPSIFCSRACPMRALNWRGWARMPALSAQPCWACKQARAAGCGKGSTFPHAKPENLF